MSAHANGEGMPCISSGMAHTVGRGAFRASQLRDVDRGKMMRAPLRHGVPAKSLATYALLLQLFCFECPVASRSSPRQLPRAAAVAPGGAVIAKRVLGGSLQALPAFPFGAYSDPPYGCLFEPGCGGRTDYLNLPEVEATHGMNFFTPYLSAQQGHNESTWAAIEAYLQRAEELGVSINYALNHLCGGAKEGGCGADKVALIRTEVQRVKKFKSITMWYISDEPDGKNVPPADFAAAAAVIRDCDGPHPRPISVVLDKTSNQTHALPYTLVVDILMADPYPIGHSAPQNNVPGDRVSSVAVATDAVVDLIRTAAARDSKVRQAIMVPQAFGALGSHWARNPTRYEGRVMVYLMVMHGAHGILLYARRAPYTMPTNQVLWGEYRAMALEMAEITPWIILGTRTTLDASVTSDLSGSGAVGVDGVHAVQFTLDGSTVLLVTNVSASRLLWFCSFVALTRPSRSRPRPTRSHVASPSVA